MKVRALGAFLFAFALLGSAGPQPNDLVARGKNGVVVTQDPHATQVGLDVLASGGNKRRNCRDKLRFGGPA